MALVEHPQRHRFTVAEYHRMGELGLLDPGTRVELIDGEVIDMAPIGPEHASTVVLLTNHLPVALAGRALLSVQNPVRLSDVSEPQPDLLLLRPRVDFYRADHPGPDDVLLAIEVSVSSRRFDQEVKLPLYARHGIVEVWLIDLVERTVLVASDPAPDGYRSEEVRRGDDLLTILDHTLRVCDVLP